MINVRKGNGQIRVECNYSRAFVKKAHELGGNWESPEWVFNEKVEDSLRKALLDLYGEDGVEDPHYVVVRFPARAFTNESEIIIDGYQIAKRFSRDDEVKITADDAFVYSGGFRDFGGSSQHPTINAKDNTVIQAVIPKLMYERHAGEMTLVKG